MQMIEQWIQFAQGHRKYSPAFEFNKKHCQLLQIVLEEHQKAWTGIAEWHDPQLVTMTVSLMFNKDANVSSFSWSIPDMRWASESSGKMLLLWSNMTI